MNDEQSLRAREFVSRIELPAPRMGVARGVEQASFEAERDQALVVGSDLVSFVKNVTPEQRADVTNALLLAQLAAKSGIGSPASLADLERWYAQYFDVLSHIGFQIQDQDFRRYHEKGDGFQAHEAILEVAATLLGGAPAALAVLQSTMSALQRASAGEPWVTIFNRESHSSTAARFQVSTVDATPAEGLVVYLAAFGLETTGHLTQVLLFKFRSNEVTLQHRQGKVAIQTELLGSVRSDTASKLAAHASEYIASLPPLG